ncbi:skin secretory protein xP2-like [Ostrinia nubilalis]|uniref:skin secretory protein xP2-like n=1 Tax=Ostrinia nubilalis TaxID=29057 RepID=UPI003082549E
MSLVEALAPEPVELPSGDSGISLGLNVHVSPEGSREGPTPPQNNVVEPAPCAPQPAGGLQCAPQPAGGLQCAPQPAGGLQCAPQPAGDLQCAPQPAGDLQCAPGPCDEYCEPILAAYWETLDREERQLRFLEQRYQPEPVSSPPIYSIAPLGEEASLHDDSIWMRHSAVKVMWSQWRPAAPSAQAPVTSSSSPPTSSLF